MYPGGIVSGDEAVGGMVGSMIGGSRRTKIRYASVSGGVIAGNHRVGGLVGGALVPDIRYAYVSGGVIAGTSSDIWRDWLEK